MLETLFGLFNGVLIYFPTTEFFIALSAVGVMYALILLVVYIFVN